MTPPSLVQQTLILTVINISKVDFICNIGVYTKRLCTLYSDILLPYSTLFDTIFTSLYTLY